jgi:hypothetical protein
MGSAVVVMKGEYTIAPGSSPCVSMEGFFNGPYQVLCCWIKGLLHKNQRQRIIIRESAVVRYDEDLYLWLGHGVT